MVLTITLIVERAPQNATYCFSGRLSKISKWVWTKLLWNDYLFLVSHNMWCILCTLYLFILLVRVHYYILKFKFILIEGWLLYNIVLVLPHINMNPPWAYTCSWSWIPLPPPSLYHPNAPAPRILYWTWTGYSFLIWYYTCFHAIPLIIPPSPSPTESKRLFYTSVSLLLSRIQGYRYRLSKFHIYALVYIGNYIVY